MTKTTKVSPPFEPMEILDSLPIGVVITSTNDRISYVNTTACIQFGLAPTDLIGKRRSALPARKALTLSKSIRRVKIKGQGDSLDRWYECISQKINGVDGLAELSCFVDATHHEERDSVRRIYSDLHDPERIDPVTGLFKKAAVRQELTAQVSRSRRYNNPLSIIMLRIALEDRDQPVVAELERQRALRNISRMLRDKLRWVDIVGCWGKSEFLMVLPETCEEPATNLAKKIRGYIKRLKPLHDNDEPSLPVRIGVTEWLQGDDVNSLVERVEHELHGETLQPHSTVEVV